MPVSYTHLDVYKRQQGDTKTTFEGDATFNGAHFTQEANFNEVTFNKVADFSGPTGKNTIFKEKAIFIGCLLYTSRCV